MAGPAHHLSARLPGVTGWLRRWIFGRPLTCFLTMSASFVAFGAGSLNLFYLYKANLALIADFGWQALFDGGAMQLAELLITTLLSLGAYTLFKACEHALVEQLLGPPAAGQGHHPSPEDEP
jgi:hypothetical protein